MEFGIRAIDFFKESLSLLPLKHTTFHHRLVFRSRSHAHRMSHFMHGRSHEHVATFLAKPQITVATSFGRRDARGIIHINVLGKIRVLVIEVNCRIHHRRNTPVGILFIFRRIIRFVETILYGRQRVNRKTCDQ